MATTVFNLGGGRIKTLTLLQTAHIGGDGGSLSFTVPKSGTYLAFERFGVVSSNYSATPELEMQNATVLFSDCIQENMSNLFNYCRVYLFSAHADKQITFKNSYWRADPAMLEVRIYGLK